MKTENTSRPFYNEFAWAFDLLIDRPVQKECHTIAAWLVERGVVPGASVLDAGCGTGRYAIELGRRGYVVRGIDMSAHLIEEANRSLGTESPQVSFAVGDILTLPASHYDAILCRGVLNDLVSEDARSSAFASFGRALRKSGVLVLDVREWDEFVMRCWTPAELQSLLGRNGFSSALYFGAYDPSVVPGETDRLVAVAQNLEAAA